MRIIDTHAHLGAEQEARLLKGVIDRAKTNGVERIVSIGGSTKANLLAIESAERFPDSIRATIGLDREELYQPVNLPELETQAANPSVVAIGESGLDYHYEPHTALDQQNLFQSMLELSVKTAKPMVVHSREADDDTLRMLTDHAKAWGDSSRPSAILHCFTGSMPFCRKLLDIGVMISFSGIVTFKNALELREVANFVPADRLLVETDSPYLAPVPHRGKPNEPAWTLHVLECLATVRGPGVEELAAVTWDNAARVFSWPGE